MLKLIIAGRRAPGRTRTAALEHLRTVHAKLVLGAPADAGPMPADYVQNHVIDGAYPGSGDYAIERDLITELWFDSVDHLRASTTTPYYMTRLRPDEPRFVDDATVARMIVRAETLLDGDRGRFKALVFLSDQDDATSRFLGAAGLVAAIRNVVLPPPQGTAPFARTVLEGWFANVDQALAAAEEMMDNGRPAVDRTRMFAVAAEEFDTARLKRGDG